MTQHIKYKSIFGDKLYTIYNRVFNDKIIKQLEEQSKFYMLEAVINPEEYLKDVEKKLDKFLLKNTNKNNNAKFICFKLGFLFSNERIQFIYQNKILNGAEKYIKYGINKGATQPDKSATIGIFCNDILRNIQKDDIFRNEFKKWFLFILKHELIHRGQNLKIQDSEIRAEVMAKNYKNKIEYLSDPQEIMARAWEIVELFKIYYNLSNNKIIEILKKSDNFMGNETLYVYRHTFNNDSKQIKLLYKYIYLYITNNN
jgi:hypothetical protein